ncbi:MAG: hypothetical protein ABI162_05805 [Luteolibacter sp.]
MSLLPQRKKSAEEIAKLRETFGIPGQNPVAEDASAPVSIPAPAPVAIPAPEPVVETPVAEVIPVTDTIPVVHLDLEPVETLGGPAVHLDLLPVVAAPQVHAPRPVRSLKRSERIPMLSADESEPTETHVEPAPVSANHSLLPKPVRSLRKSEQVPITPVEIHTPPADSSLPVHRHSDEELNEIRRQAALGPQSQALHPALTTAHLAVVIPGYLFALGGAVCFYYYELSISITAGCVAAALLVSGFIFLKKPLSRHHAAFIAVISLFVIVFGALHYFPQLRHGT